VDLARPAVGHEKRQPKSLTFTGFSSTFLLSFWSLTFSFLQVISQKLKMKSPLSLIEEKPKDEDEKIRIIFGHRHANSEAKNASKSKLNKN
jgi:hypothetical protein